MLPNRYLPILFLCSFLFSQDKTLSLQALLVEAVKNNYDAKSQKYKEKIAQQEARKDLGNLLPTVQGAVDYNYFHDLPVFASDNGVIRSGTKHRLMPELSLEQPIFDATAFQNYSRSSLLQKVEKLQTAKTKLEVISEVKIAYFQYLLLLERQKTIEASVQRLDKSVVDMTLKLENGLVQRLDVDRIQVLLNDANLELAKIKRQIPYQVLWLKYLANLDMQEPVGFSGSLQEFFDMHKNTVVEEQPAENLDVLLAAQQSKIAKTQAKWQGAKYLPTINLVAGYQFNFLNNNFSNLTSKYYPTSFVGVSAKIVLFKSLNKTWALKSAVLQAKLADNILEKTKTETDVLLVKQRMELLNSLEESNTQSANVALADLNFQNIYHQYNNGLRSSLDLLNAQETLQNASLLHVQAMYNVLMYQTLLEKTLGFTSENL